MCTAFTAVTPTVSTGSVHDATPVALAHCATPSTKLPTVTVPNRKPPPFTAASNDSHHPFDTSGDVTVIHDAVLATAHGHPDCPSTCRNIDPPADDSVTVSGPVTSDGPAGHAPVCVTLTPAPPTSTVPVRASPRSTPPTPSPYPTHHARRRRRHPRLRHAHRIRAATRPAPHRHRRRPRAVPERQPRRRHRRNLGARWSEVFLDPTAAAAVIDRIVHHATVLQTSGGSFRLQAAKRTQAQAFAEEETR